MKKLIVLTSILIVAAVSQAAIVVSWDGVPNNVLSANLDIAKTPTFLSTAGYQSPATGQSNVMSPNFYAAISDVSDQFKVFNGGNADLLGRVQVTGDGLGLFTSMLAWDVTSTLTLDTLKVTGFNDFGVGASDAARRFLFQDSASDWYASDAEVLAGSTIDVDAVAWYDYTPHAGGTATIGALATISDFDDVQMVGYYQEFNTTGGGGVYSTGFEASVVPEPATFGLLGMFGAAMLIIRRRFKR